MRTSFFVLAAFLVVAYASHPLLTREEYLLRQGRAFEETVKTIIECVRDLMINGDPDVNLPPLEPVKLPEAIVDLDSFKIPNVTGVLTVKDLYVEGLTKFEINSLKNSIELFPPAAKVEFGLVSPVVKFKATYTAKGHVFGVDLVGSGDITFESQGFNANGFLHVLVSGLKVNDLDVHIALNSIQFKIDGLMNDKQFSQYVSELVTKQLPTMLQENDSKIAKMIRDVVLDVLSNCERSAFAAEDPIDIACSLVQNLHKKCLKLG